MESTVLPLARGLGGRRRRGGQFVHALLHGLFRVVHLHRLQIQTRTQIAVRGILNRERLL